MKEIICSYYCFDMIKFTRKSIFNLDIVEKFVPEEILVGF